MDNTPPKQTPKPSLTLAQRVEWSGLADRLAQRQGDEDAQIAAAAIRVLIQRAVAAQLVEPDPWPYG